MGIRKLLNIYRGLDHSIYFLCLAQVVNSIGHFIHPFLTMFLTQKIGMDPVEAGTYVMLSAAAWVPGSLMGGKFADQIGRKRVLVSFQSLAAATLVPCAFLGVSRIIPWLLIASSFLHGVAEPVNDAMITDLTAAEQRKGAFSLPLQLSAAFAEGGPGRYGTIMSFNAVVVIILTTFVVHTTERIKPALTVAISSLFFAVGFGMIGYLHTLPLLLVSTLIWTVGEILEATNTSVYVANHAPITHRGRINAIAPIVMWSGFGFGPPLSAQFIDRFSLSSIWPLCFALCLLAAVLLFVLHFLEMRSKRGAG